MGTMLDIKADKLVTTYMASPVTEPKGAVIVIHEVWGLTDHTKSIADRLADSGFISLAPDLIDTSEFSSAKLAELQKNLFDPEKRNAVQPELRRLTAPIHEPEFGQLTIERLSACFNYLYDLPESQQKVSVVGFCFGGTYSFALAIAEQRLKLAIPFYGHCDQPVEELQKITCPIRAFYGENDENLMNSLPDLTERMKQAKIDFKTKVYPNCGHAFFNDTNPNAFNKAAADDAWREVTGELAKI